MKRIPIYFLLLATFGGVIRLESGHCQGAAEELLSRIPARNSGDNNRYSLTDIQFALRARLDWNALLRRARVINEESGLTFTLVVGSSLGSCGTELVEWPHAPTIRSGQIFVSEGLLKRVFEIYPDFRMEGQEEEPLDSPPIAALEEMALEEPPELYSEETPKKLANILAVFIPSDQVIVDGTSAKKSVAERLEGKVSQNASIEGITLDTEILDSGDIENTYQKGDALVAFRVTSSSPTTPSAFFYYDSPSLPNQNREQGLVEWDRVTPRQRGGSRSLAEVFHRNFSEIFGSGRAIGVRGAPIQLLQGRRIPSIQVNLGISSASEESEIDQMIEVIGRSLSQLNSED